MTTLHTRCLWVVLACACTDPSAGSPDHPGVPPPREPGELTEAVVEALTEGDAAALAEVAATSGLVRVEIRQTLVETDERQHETLEGAEAVAAWHARLSSELECDGETCRFPGGLVTNGTRRCFGDCCDINAGPDVVEGKLYFQRACFAARQDGEPRLSYLVFAAAE